MSEQGDRPNRPTTEDDWWSRLYDDSAADTGRPTASADSLDDRFVSASGTVTTRPHAWWDPPPPPPAGRVGERGVRGDGPATGGPARTPSVPDRPAGPPPSPATRGPGAGDAPQSAALPSPAPPTRLPGDPPPGAAPAPPADATRLPGDVVPGGGSVRDEASGAASAAPATATGLPGDVAADDPVPPVRHAPPGAGAPPAPATRPPDPGAASAHTGSGAAPAGEDPRGAAVAPPARTPPMNSPPSGLEGAGAPPRPDRRPGRSAVAGDPRDNGRAASGSTAGDRPAGGPPTRPAGSAQAQPAAGSDPREGPPPRRPAPAGDDARRSAAAAPRAVVPAQAPRGGVVGDGPPTYDAEPTALPAAETDALDQLVADTVLDGATYGTYTLRAASVRGDSARFRGEPRRDALLTARFGTGPAALVLVAVAGGIRGSDTAHLAAADACRWIGRAVGRSHARLAEDIRAGRRGDLKSGLHRLTDRSLGRLRARAAELGVEPEAYTSGLRCLLLSADPACRTRVFFGVGGGGLFRLRDGVWQDLEPPVPDRADVTGAPVVGFGSAVPEATPDGDRLTMDLGIPTGPAPYIEAPPPPVAEPFRFRASVARPGDTLLLCSPGLAAPVRGEAALVKELAERWRGPEPPGMAQFLADTQLRVKGYADDRTAVAVWEA
ncbi:hypothetical protein GLX30_07705 [Streptomyces sp. Tu 2975]|uniref:protein phosphatase 2C domain-containing protein n=1 Tax=Streptomyces sp. Tu 2975 TaxID=2676871 RepID=UPI001357609B|nr:protein phosphatase 2C domain-containing protein [Streptomyces sp. Tu 2975]QIP83957.1 hypothetical protein GLX30_07705 [Streptomyces sp. Tu 2975]